MKQKNRFLKLSTACVGIFVLLVLAVSPGDVTPAVAQGGIDARTYDVPRVLPHEFRGDVRNLPQIPSKPKVEVNLREPVDQKPALLTQSAISPNLVLAPAPAASHNFAGMSFGSSCTGGTCGAGLPPDTNGDVGPNHYVQAVNSAFAIYNKSGTLLAAFTENSLWAGTGSNRCNGDAVGDPVVIYDSRANRWILTNLAFAFDIFGNPVAPYYECIAVSKTGDPVSGGWTLYPIRTDTGVSGQPPVGTLNDYPKFGIWTDCLYYSANGFNSAGNYVGGEFASFSRSDMYAGKPLTGALGFKASSAGDYFTMIPSNLSAPTANGLPPAGTPDYYVQESVTAFQFLVRKFTAGTNCGSGTLSTATAVSQACYIYPGNSTTEAIVPQPGSSIKLDSLGDRLMQKVQYRRVGSVESLWVTHTFRSTATGPTGLQWAQLNVTGGTIAMAPVQQQLYNPGDGVYRWMGSIAADRDGNVAVAYSTSNASSPNFPGIAYAGRLATDPLNSLPQAEQKLVTGAAPQNTSCGGAPCTRWGDYSSMSVDPADGCTFWFTNEYYASQSAGTSGQWNTRIGSFRFPSCGLRTFYSTAAQDGWVLESGQTTSIGGSLDANASTFALGDDAQNRQYRAVLSFNTASLPDNARITAVVLKIRQAGQSGGNPFNTLGNIAVDMQTGAFNGNVALELPDFQAAASQNAAMAITNTPVSGWYSQSLGAAYFPLVSLTGTTQFRLRFAIADNNNHLADTLSFYSGDFTTTPSLRPTLQIRYNLP